MRGQRHGYLWECPGCGWYGLSMLDNLEGHKRGCKKFWRWLKQHGKDLAKEKAMWDKIFQDPKRLKAWRKTCGGQSGQA